MPKLRLVEMLGKPDPSLFEQLTPSTGSSVRPRHEGEQILRPDGQFACIICGAPAYFGFDVKLTLGRLGLWACPEHRETVKSRR
ncbi:MAG TPA: hypothetical protein VME69_11955 [Methylocella sp.]|nr:hypothetical protein [Methylocella sp.]